MTKDSPRLFVRMLGSAALELPGRSRLGLKVAAGGGAARDVHASPTHMAAISDATAPTDTGRDNLFLFIAVYFLLKL
jgi:hypothetical protein